MGTEQLKELSEKVHRGLEISFKKLLNKLSAEDGELVISQKGKVVRVKARDFDKR